METVKNKRREEGREKEKGGKEEKIHTYHERSVYYLLVTNSSYDNAGEGRRKEGEGEKVGRGEWRKWRQRGRRGERKDRKRRKDNELLDLLISSSDLLL